jgi:hypothetical protein
MLIKRAITLILRHFRSFDKTPIFSGVADISVFDKCIANYRMRGTKIGKKVRLPDQIDGINPHLVSIGDYSVVGVDILCSPIALLKGPQKCTIGNYCLIAVGLVIAAVI